MERDYIYNRLNIKNIMKELLAKISLAHSVDLIEVEEPITAHIDYWPGDEDVLDS